MMKYLLHFFIIGAIFGIGTIILPDVIITNGIGTVIIATIVYWFMGTAFITLIVGGFIIVLLEGVIKKYIPAIIILSVILVLFASFISLSITELLVPGFEIVGFLPQLVIAFLSTLFTSSIKLKTD